METASFYFVLFGLAVAIVSNLNRSAAWRSTVLFAATAIFLALLTRNPILFLPLAGFLLLGYAGLIFLDHGGRKWFVWFLIAVIFTYIWLKKYTFLPQVGFLGFSYLTLGLSYIFFRVLHLLVEARDDETAPKIGFGAYLLYTLNFTTFVSGPIQHYEDFARDQFAAEPIGLGPRVIGLQIERIIRGFFKVNVLATLLQALQEDAHAQVLQPVPDSVRVFAAFRMAVIYPIFLYCNFSGYIDIVIALARLMRLRLPENFDRPFSASSFIDFWNRWHITLSSWLKTYVYNPLLIAQMRRVSSPMAEQLSAAGCLFVTFLLVGIWHGRTPAFMFFGVLQGAGVSINRLWQMGLTQALSRKRYRVLAANPIYTAFARGLTFSWFAFTLFWFWTDWHEIDRIYSAVGLLRWLAIWLSIWICATVILAMWEGIRSILLAIRTAGEPVLTGRYALVVYASALALACFVFLVLLNRPAPDIVYGAF